MAQKSLYDRLGGAFAIAAVVDRFSDAIIHDRVAGDGSDNPALREWHTKELARLPGLKFMRTLWLCNVSGGPQGYVGTRPGHDRLGLEEAHRNLHIDSEEFDAVAGILSRTLDEFQVPAEEKAEVLSAFAAHKGEVTEGSRQPAAAMS
nr:Bacterial-like globin [uncultured bacterium]AIA13605.1 Bacterial-like globin [uncultured bacterium]